MLMVVYTVANGIETVVVADVETVSEIDYICHAFTGYTLHCLTGESESQMVGYGLRHLYA